VFPAELTLWASGTARAPSYNAFVRDLTSAQAQAVELAAAHAAALEGSRLKSEFVANMSHEIRTPMNGVLGMTALLQDTDLDRLQRDYVDTVGSCAESLLTVIDDILDFSKIEAGKLEVEAVDVELRPLVEEVAGLLSSSATGRELEVVAWIDPAVPDFVHGDPHRLRQVLSNLVGNAVKYTERGEVVVRVQPSGTSDDRVLFSVRDTGIGISAEQRLRLFEAFAQADASTTRKYGGTGLGLTISRQLVELMGGPLDVESTPGVGSTFFFELPLPAAPRPRTGSRSGPAWTGCGCSSSTTTRPTGRCCSSTSPPGRWSRPASADAEAAVAELAAAVRRPSRTTSWSWTCRCRGPTGCSWRRRCAPTRRWPASPWSCSPRPTPGRAAPPRAGGDRRVPDQAGAPGPAVRAAARGARPGRGRGGRAQPASPVAARRSAPCWSPRTTRSTSGWCRPC
jgi:signal transduction histidine kinase